MPVAAGPVDGAAALAAACWAPHFFSSGRSLVAAAGRRRGETGMRNGVRRIGFVGVPDRSVAESLREYGYRVDGIGGGGVIRPARGPYPVRPAAIHARAGHLQAAPVARPFDGPPLVHGSCEGIGPPPV